MCPGELAAQGLPGADRFIVGKKKTATITCRGLDYELPGASVREPRWHRFRSSDSTAGCVTTPTPEQEQRSRTHQSESAGRRHICCGATRQVGVGVTGVLLTGKSRQQEASNIQKLLGVEIGH